jgi:hypothetical protein
VNLRVNGDKKALLRIDADQQRREQAKRVLPKEMRVVVGIIRLAAVLDLKGALVRRSVPFRRPGRKEGVCDDPIRPPSRVSKVITKGARSGGRGEEHPTAGGPKAVQHEAQQRLSSGSLRGVVP